MADDFISSYYDILGVAQSASSAEIRAAEVALRKLYERRSKQGDAAAMRILMQLNEAHATLAQEHKRAAYDRRADVIAGGLIDVAYSPRIGRFEKLEELDEWLADNDPCRAATLLDGELPRDLLEHHPLLDDA